MASQGQLRCTRCCMVVFDVFTQIMQDLMKESGVPPIAVYQKIMNAKRFRDKLNPTEMDIIQSLTTTDGFSKLDVSLIYKIVKYFNTFIPQPRRRWGSDPQPGEIEVGDDVERIRRARNVLTHKIKAEVTIGEMNDFFTTFIDVGRRMDQHLGKPTDGGFEQAFRNYRELNVDDEMAEQHLEALHQKESFKEKFAVKVVSKEIHIYVGRTMDEAINNLRQSEADSTTQVKFIIDGVDDPDQQIEMLNTLQGEINTEGSNIQFKKATRECIAVYCLVKNKVLQEEDVLKKEVCGFIKNILEALDVGSRVKGEISVIMASAEDDSEIYNSLICSPVETDPRGIWGGSNSLVLNLEIKSAVFETSDTLQKYMTDFFVTLLKKTNGRQLIKQKEVNVILESGDQDVNVNVKEDNENTSEEDKVLTFPSFEDVDSVEDISYSESEYAMAPSPGTPNKEEEDRLDEISSDTDYGKAQCRVGGGLAKIPPKFRRLKRTHDKEEGVKHWKYYFGFRRLLELKEKDSMEIIHTFHSRKVYLMEALNDIEMYNNREIIIFLLHSFAKCCESDIMPEKVSDIFEILQYSSFLKESVVRFIDEIASVSKLQRENYYQKSMKDLFVVLNDIKSHKAVYKDCLGPIMAVIEKRDDFFKDSEIFDEGIWRTIQELKDFTSQMDLKADNGDEIGRHEISGVNKSAETLGGKKTRSRPDRKQSRRSGIEPEKWRLAVGFSKLSKLKDVSGEEILRTFIDNVSDLKDALNDENLAQNKDMVSLFLRCFAKSSQCELLNHSQVQIFEILIESVFLERHVMCFVEGIAAETLQKRIIPTKQSLKDIFSIFGAFNSLIPQSVSRIHSILTSMDTSINIIHAQQRDSELMDEDMWHAFHTLLDRRTATSPEKRL